MCSLRFSLHKFMHLKFFGPYSKACIFKVCAAWGRVSRGLTVYSSIQASMPSQKRGRQIYAATNTTFKVPEHHSNTAIFFSLQPGRYLQLIIWMQEVLSTYLHMHYPPTELVSLFLLCTSKFWYTSFQPRIILCRMQKQLWNT